METWRLLQDGAGGPAWNMAVDEALLDAASTNAGPSVLRLYEWERPAVSIGRFQDIGRTLNLGSVRERDVDLVRRITGGRGILHGADLTISIVCSTETLGFSESAGTLDIYGRLAEGFLSAFAELGISAAQGAQPLGRAGETRGDCFATVTRADIMDRESGCKLLGSAMYRRDRWILQQTSVPFEALMGIESTERHERLCDEVFRGASARYLSRPYVGCSMQGLRAAVARGFERALGCRLQADGLCEIEAATAAGLERERYLDHAWTQGESRRLNLVSVP